MTEIIIISSTLADVILLTHIHFRCENCQSVFHTNHALTIHLNGRWCRRKHEMSEQQLRQLRRCRQVSNKRIGWSQLTVEPVNIFDVNGNQIAATGEFKYLGTMVSNHGGATREVK